MLLYHGSTVIVDCPMILPNQRTLDFGQGFYTTSNREQAVRWAQKVKYRRNAEKCFLSVYEFDKESAEKELKILEFKKADKEWLEFVCDCRMGKLDAIEYDIVHGAVADDTVYAAIQLFELGLLDEEETLKRLKIQKLYDQLLFHTEKALNHCLFMQAVEL